MQRNRERSARKGYSVSRQRNEDIALAVDTGTPRQQTRRPLSYLFLGSLAVPGAIMSFASVKKLLKPAHLEMIRAYVFKTGPA